MLLLSTQAITKNTLYNIDTHLTNINDIRYKTIQVNNNKIKNYENASELLKKSANDYYYLIILIIFSIIILMFGMSLYLLYPTMLLNIVIFAIIPFIILVFYVMYKINRSTRMAEDKKYWSIYNPSSTLLTTL
jgi:fatty-acid desaturase